MTGCQVLTRRAKPNKADSLTSVRKTKHSELHFPVENLKAALFFLNCFALFNRFHQFLLSRAGTVWVSVRQSFNLSSLKTFISQSLPGIVLELELGFI